MHPGIRRARTVLARVGALVLFAAETAGGRGALRVIAALLLIYTVAETALTVRGHFRPRPKRQQAAEHDSAG
jgi:hypothetical protein